MPVLALQMMGILAAEGCSSDVTLSPADNTQTSDTATLPEGGFTFSGEGFCDVALSVEVVNVCPTVLRPDGEIPDDDADANGLDDTCEDYFATAQTTLVEFIVRTAGVEALDGCPPLTYHAVADRSESDQGETLTRTARLWLNFSDAVGEIDAADYRDCNTKLPQEALCLDVTSTQPIDELSATGFLGDSDARAYDFSVVAVGPEGPDETVSLHYKATRAEALEEGSAGEASLTVGGTNYTNDGTHDVDAALLSGASMVGDTLDSLGLVCDYDWLGGGNFPTCEDNIN